jgi:hypothetical protein
MLDNHEVLCPNFIDCEICQRIRDTRKIYQIEKFTGNLETLDLQNKHFYILEITHQPKRETYYRFTLNPLKKVGRELINGLSSISGVSNRKWFKMYVESGLKFYTIKQLDKEDYPIFKLSLLMFSSKDDLDTRMHHQLKFRIRKIHKDLEFKFNYIGKFDKSKIMNQLDVESAFDIESAPFQKFDDELRNEINKIKSDRPTIFGKLYQKKQPCIELQAF